MKKNQLLKNNITLSLEHFSVEENANKLQSRLNSWNYNSTIIRNQNIMRVSYDEFASKEEALVSRKKLEKKIQKPGYLHFNYEK